MGLSCSCDYDGDYDWYYTSPNDYSVMPYRSRRVRCASCKKFIEQGAVCTEFWCHRPGRSDYEMMRFGEDYDAIELASKWHCEECADIYFSLYELGFHCIAPDEDMFELAREHKQLTSSRRMR